MTALPDYYATLEVSELASPEVITSAYRSLARKYHPDANPSPEANARMKAINVAYDVLGDPNKRADYDRQRTAAKQSPRPAPARPATPPPASHTVPRAQHTPAQTPLKTSTSQSAPHPTPQATSKPGAQKPASAVPPRRTGSTFLASPGFTTFVLTFVIAFAILTIIAEAFTQYDYEWLIIPMAVVIAIAAAIWKSRQR